MIKWTEYASTCICVEFCKKIKDGNILGNNKKTVRAMKSEKKPSLTKNKKIAIGIISAGALALAVFAVLVFVFDLGPMREIKSSEEDARVIGKCDGYDVRHEELRYLTLLYRAELDGEMGEYSTLSAEDRASYENALESRVLTAIKNRYAVLSLCDKYDIDTNSSEVRKYVRDSIESLADELGGRNEYISWLDENNLTDALIRSIYKAEYLEMFLLEELTKRGDEIKYSDSNLDDFVKFIMEDESYIKVIHAYYPKEHQYIDTSGMKERAENALAQIKSAKNDEDRLSYMSSAIGQAPFVPGYSVTGSDYYITYGQMNENYERMAYSLDEYAVGDVLELEEGYYIIMRVPKVRDEVAPRAYELIDQYRYAVLKQLVDKQKDNISFDGNDYFKSINLIEIK